MAFRFGRGRQGQFKHIAHGLIPAVTIAPKPAVPRTPPPRSPNPSPERPRSALAAAILVTTLAGRSVALPQPRQRSLSESDASHLQNQESYIEPYATFTELQMGPNWKSDGDDKSAVQSVDVSGSLCEDEDMDTFASDIEKEPEPNNQAIKQEESDGSEAVYAIPHKIKKGNPPVSSSTEVEEDEPHDSSILHPNILVEEIEPPVEYCKVEKVEKPLIEKPPPTPDVILRKKQGQMDLTIEKFQKLKEENWRLNNANQTLLSELGEMKLRLKELQLKMKNFKKENAKLKDNEQTSHREEEQAELLLLRQQAQELVDENDSLKMTVHRLNVELSRYQAKYRPISSNEGVSIGSLPGKGPPPPWLLDMKYLSPLLLAYEDRMREKEDLILAHEEDMKNFKMRVEEVVKENEQLHQQLCKCSSVSTKEWQQLKSHAKLVLEENTILMEQLKIQQAKAKDNHSQHVQDVSKLTKQLMVLEAKKQSQEKEMKMCQKQLEESQSTVKGLKASFKDCVPMEEHIALVNQFKSQLQQEQEKREAELQELMGKLASVQAEKKSLVLQKNELVAEKEAVEAELEMAQRAKRKSQKKIVFLIQLLEETIEKEKEAYQYLENLTVLAENGIKDRSHLLTLTSCLEKKNQGFINEIIEGGVRLGRIEEKVKVYKTTAAEKLKDFALRVTEHEKEFAGKTAQYQRQMKHLQQLLQDRQETLDQVLQQKREVESELEIIWESTTKENRKMKELLHKSLEKSTQSPVRAYESHLADISQKDLLGGYGFSYCDVELSTPAKSQSQQEP
ncbi:centrosomal protein of 89 kDa [Heteronotia binoei]|uniref:centrosomal protein of 89 kDa n=1 Tax=Heteronotia binoei TaxID=13085 RepID=UPI0029310DB6|nr:centrosomal protein of 89 kDa [Heteronotia binoei]